MFDKRLLLTGAIFRSRVENEIYANSDGTYSQIGTKRVTGVELSDAMATYRIRDKADVQLNLFNVFNKLYMTSLNHLGHRYQPGLARSLRARLDVYF